MKKLFLVIAIHLLILSLIQYTAWPENFLWPYLLNHGLKLYTDIFYIYPPFYALVLAGLTKIFGVSLTSLTAISHLNIALTDFLLYLVAKKKLLPVLIFIPLQIFFEGNGFWPDQMLAPLFLLAYWSFQQKKYLLLGLILALALLTKQTAGYFIIGFGILTMADKNLQKNLLSTLKGFGFVLLILLIWSLFNQNLSAFFEQTLKYILTHHVGNSIETLWPSRQQIMMIILVFAPAVLIGILKKHYSVVLLMLLATLGMFTRFSYFHLQPALPFAAILLSENFLLAAVPYFVFLIFFFRMVARDWQLQPRFMSPIDIQNARQASVFIKPGDKTLFIASSDHYYYLTDTLPAGNFFASSTPWNLSYPGIQEKYIANLITFQPKFVFLGKCMWEKGICYEPRAIKEYLLSHYRKILELPDGTGVFENNPVSF